MSVEDSQLRMQPNPFGKKMRDALVKKFVYLHKDNKIQLRTTNPVTRLLKDKLKRELDELLKTRTGSNEHRQYLADQIIEKQEDLQNTSYNETYPALILDERFKDLAELEKKYTGEITIPSKAWRKVEKELYPLVMMLYNEKRITGKFDLPPLQDYLQLEEVKDKLNRIQSNLEINTFDLKVLKTEAKSKGWNI